MKHSEFEWDEKKNKTNLKKHNISFEIAKEVFKDTNRIEAEDTRKDYGEKRFVTIGKVKNLILTVVYTIRNTAKRLISARRASKKEREYYFKQNETKK